MSKKLAYVLMAACVMLPVYSLDVDKAELQSTGKTIEFINYEGPHDRIESADSIRGIGQSLGAFTARGAKRGGELGRYYVIHAVDPAEKKGFDADIILIGEGAQVDHVTNLRRIVSGYLQSAYKYSAKDADTLAVFISIYNAVYRKNINYFNGKYKKVVLQELSADKVGLSIRWDEWAGRSQIVIPLTDKAGGGVIGSVDTGAISDKPTVQSLKEEKAGSAAEERMGLVDIKERSQEQEKAAIAAEKERIAKEEAALAAKKAEADKAKAAADKAAADKAAADKAAADKAAADKTASDKAAPDKAAADKAAADKTGKQDDGAKQGDEQKASVAQSEQAKKEAAATAEREKQIEKDKAAVAEREKAAAEKDKEIAADRESIAKDQKEEIKKEVETAAAKEAGGTVLFQLVDPAKPLSRIVLFDLKDNKTLRRSDLNTIRASSIIDDGNAFVAVAGQFTGAGGTIRLVRIDKADYKNVIQGAADLFEDTLLWKFGNSVYAVMKKSGGWAIGRFNPATLELQASSEAVSPWTFLTQTQGALVAQDVNGAFMVMDPETLAVKK